MKTHVDVKEEVRKRYGAAATRNSGCCGGDTSQAKAIGYTSELEGVSPDVVSGSLGCGNPHAFTRLKEGDVVLDIGSGVGLDALVASKKVGATGRVVGVDMTPEMIERATRHAREAGVTNVDFRLAEVEKLPLPNDYADWAMSNCVINLTPDKPTTFREIFRVLKPGGRLSVSDIVLETDIPDSLRENMDAYAACVSGAILEAEYLDAILKAGFTDVAVTRREGSEQCGSSFGVHTASVHVTATKPSS